MSFVRTVHTVPRRIAVLGLLVLVLLALSPSRALAQRGDDSDRASKNGKAVQAIGDSHVTVEYGRPCVKGREVWGELVSYGKVWAPGANEATTLTFTTDVLLAGHELKAGSYSLWAIPAAEEWTLIVSTEADLWHTAYNPEHDLFRFTVTPESSVHFELLTFTFRDVTANSANLVFLWDKLAVSIPITLP